MKYILPYLRPYRRQTALAMVLVAFATVCDLLLSTIMNDILNHGVRQSDFAYIVRCCVWMLAVAAAGLAALLAGRKISCDVVAGFNADLRTDVFSLVNNMTFEEFNAIGAAALLYLVPFVLLFLGYAIGNALGWAEGGCVLIGFGFFALGVASNVIYQRKKKASPITFEIIQIRES